MLQFGKWGKSWDFFVEKDKLHYVGIHRGSFEAVFHDRLFKDNEWSSVYVYTEPVEIGDMILQESEVEEVIWMDYEECRKKFMTAACQTVFMKMNFRWLENISG